MTWVYLNLTRFCFGVPYALDVEKNDDKKSKKLKNSHLPTLIFV